MPTLPSCFTTPTQEVSADAAPPSGTPPRGANVRVSRPSSVPPPLLDALSPRPGVPQRGGRTAGAKIPGLFDCFTLRGADRLEWNKIPFTVHARTGTSTTLHDYAHIMQALDQQTAARHGGVNAEESPAAQSGPLRDTQRTMREGRSDSHKAIGHAMGAMRTQFVRSTAAAGGSASQPPRPAYARLSESAVLTFLHSPDGQALAAKTGLDRPAFLSRIEEIAQARTPTLALAASFALLSSKELHDPDNTTTLGADVFEYLQKVNFRAEISNARANSAQPWGAYILRLRKVFDDARNTLTAKRCESTTVQATEPGPSMPPVALDKASLRTFMDAADKFSKSIGETLPAQPHFTWPGIRDSAHTIAIRCDQAVDAYKHALQQFADELDASGALVVSPETAEKIVRAQEALIAFVSAPPHLDEYGESLKRAELGRAVAWGALQRAATTSDFDGMLDAFNNHHTLDKSDRDKLRMHLQAGFALAAQLKAKPTPEALITACSTPRKPLSSAASFAQRVSNVTEKLITADRAEPAVLSPADKADLLGWRNGFTDDGPNSDLSRFKSRFFKMLTWIDRQSDRNPALPARHKSPLSAMRDGLAGGDRGMLTVEQKKLTDLLSKTEVTTLAQAVAQALDAEAGARHDEGAATGLSESHYALIALRVALDDWMPERVSARAAHDLVLGREFVPDALPKTVAQRVRALCTQAVDAGTSAFPDAAVGHAVERVGQHLGFVRLGLEELVQLAGHLKVDRGAAFDTVLQSARRIIDAQSARPAEATRQGMGKMLVDFMKTIPPGNSIRLSSATSKGVGTKGITENISRFVTHSLALPLLVRVDARAEKAHEAVIRLALPVHAAEFFIGTETRRRGRIGAGAFFGIKLHKFFRTGVSADVVPYEHERTDATGVTLRIPRRGDDAKVRALLGRIGDFLYSKAQARKDDPSCLPDAAAFFRAFADEFHEEQDLSLTWTDQKTRAHRSELSLGAGASALLPLTPQSGALGPSVGYTLEKQWGAKFSQIEETGSYRIINLRRQDFNRNRLGVSLTTSTTSKTTAVASTDLLTAATTFAQDGKQLNLRIVLDQGDMVAPHSIADAEFDTAEGYIEYINATKEEWIKLFSYAHRRDPDEGRAKAIQAVDAHMEKARALDGPNRQFFARWRFTQQAADKINRLQRLELQVPKGVPQLHEQIAALREQIINSPDSWLAYGLRSYERVIKQDGFNVNIGLRYAQITGLQADRQIVFDTLYPLAMNNERERDVTGVRSDSPMPVQPQAKRSAVHVSEPMLAAAVARSLPDASDTATADQQPAVQSEIESAREAVPDASRPADHPHERLPLAMPAQVLPGSSVESGIEAFVASPRAERGNRMNTDTAKGSQSLLELFLAERRNKGAAKIQAYRAPDLPNREEPQNDTAAETQAHLERLKLQMDAKAGVGSAAKQGSRFSRLFGLKNSKPQPTEQAAYEHLEHFQRIKDERDEKLHRLTEPAQEGAGKKSGLFGALRGKRGSGRK